MKLRFILALFFFSFWPLQASKDTCTIELTAKLAQDILDNTNIILPKVCSIQNDVIQIIINLQSDTELLCSKIESIDVSVTATVDLSPAIDATISVGEILCSKIDALDISVSTTVDLSPAIDATISVGEILCSKIEELDDMVSINDGIILSVLDIICSKIEAIDINVTATVDLSPAIDATISVGEILCSKIEEVEEMVSVVDATLCSKVGNLDGEGSCLEAMITVPDDIDNLNLTVIQLLKTILLEMRGCNQA